MCRHRANVCTTVIALLLLLLGCAGATEPQKAAPVVTVQTSMPSARTAVSAASATEELPPTPITTPTSVPTSVPTMTAIPTVEITSTPTTMPSPTVVPPMVAASFSYPISRPGGIPGDGFFMRHGYATENTWFNPGFWHTGEDWYALEGDTAGAEVRAVADGEVVYAGSNYPGRVVVVRHADALFSMYGHLDSALPVVEGQAVVRGDLLGTVLKRNDDVPNHLHFEIRTFLLTDVVNGSSPRYRFRCGPGCVPGPGYWPITAPELPDVLGWRNPTHVIVGRSSWTAANNVGESVVGEVVMATGAASHTLTLWTTLDDAYKPRDRAGDLLLEPDVRYAVVDARAGPEAPERTGSTAYQVWYRLRLADGRTGWVAALNADTTDRGANGAPSSVRFNFLPIVP